MAAILADSNSLSMVISPTLDFSRAISSSRSSRSCSFRADAAPASARSRHSVSLATETFASRATTSNGSPRNKIPWGVDSGRLWEQTEVVNPLNPWRRPMSLDHRCEEPTAIRSNVGAIFVSLELSRSTWLITSLSPGSGEKMSKYGILAGDLAALLARFSGLKQKAFARTGKSFSIVVIQEAGLDGFWIHRVLQSEGIESYVVDPASIATSRRRRRAKTDRIDGEALVRALLAYKRGEPRVCAIVSAPTPEDEDNRRLCRERKALTAERIQHVNRIKGLLFSQGVSDYEPLRRNRRQRLDELKTGDSRPLPMHLKAQIGRELDRLELLLEQIKAVEAERDALLASAKPTEETSALPAMLVGLKGIGPEFAAVLWSEGLYRIFANRKQVAAYAGLALRPGKWNRRARARRIQSRESAAADDDDPACLALAETSAAFGTGAMVQGTRQTQRRAPAQNDDRGACAQIVSRVVEICECRRRHRRRRNEGLLIDDLNRLTQSTETRSVSTSRWTNRWRVWFEQPTTRMVSSSWAPPAASGILVQSLRAAAECEFDLVRKRPGYGSGLKPRIPKQPQEFCLCATQFGS